MKIILSCKDNKIDLIEVAKKLEKAGYDVDRLWKDIKQIRNKD